MKKGLLIIVLMSIYQTCFASEIYWYLAASMSKPGKEIVEKFNKQSATSKVYLILGGSGGLLSRIIVSKNGDLYTPGSAFFLKKAKKNKIVKSSRLLLLQKMVVGLSASGVKKIHSFNDLIKPGVKIAFGNPKLTALGKVFLEMKGKMDEKSLKRLEKNNVVEGVNANQIANYILSDTVDAGFIFDTVAKVSKIPHIEIPKKFNVSSEAHMVLLKNAKNFKETNNFVNFVYKQNDIFSKYGYCLI